jgi:chemotaxis response regulator CheB
MRIKVLVIGDNPAAIVPDCQLLKDRGILVFTAFNPGTIADLVDEIRPDVVFFDIEKQDTVDAYTHFVKNLANGAIPVVYKLSADDVYLVTRKRTTLKDIRTIISRTLPEAIKTALRNNKTYLKKVFKFTPSHHTPPSFSPARA